MSIFESVQWNRGAVGLISIFNTLKKMKFNIPLIYVSPVIEINTSCLNGDF